MLSDLITLQVYRTKTDTKLACGYGGQQAVGSLAGLLKFPNEVFDSLVRFGLTVGDTRTLLVELEDSLQRFVEASFDTDAHCTYCNEHRDDEHGDCIVGELEYKVVLIHRLLQQIDKTIKLEMLG